MLHGLAWRFFFFWQCLLAHYYAVRFHCTVFGSLPSGILHGLTFFSGLTCSGLGELHLFGRFFFFWQSLPAPYYAVRFHCTVFGSLGILQSSVPSGILHGLTFGRFFRVFCDQPWEFYFCWHFCTFFCDQPWEFYFCGRFCI